MPTYRTTFLHNIKCNYWNKKGVKGLSFQKIADGAYPFISKIKTYAHLLNIVDFWHFYEPYMEITWISNQREADILFEFIEEELKKENITDLKRHIGNGMQDWFCENDIEREFGAKRHALSSDFVDLIYKYKESIGEGKGVNAQIGRTIHTICNPLGKNYTEEAKICFSRGLICLLFRFFEHKKAVWIYRHIFRQRY